MKVKDFMNKVNYGSAKLPVYLKEGVSGTARKAMSTDFAGGYYYAEAERTVKSISIETDRVIVYYK